MPDTNEMEEYEKLISKKLVKNTKKEYDFRGRTESQTFTTSK